MYQENYNLTWHNYSDHLKNMMKELMMNDDYSDVTLVTEDKKYLKANVYVLSACSPVFKEIFKRDKNSSSIMYLRGIHFPEMESILQFIYLGNATFYEERMDEFLAVAKLLEIKELCNAENLIMQDRYAPTNDEQYKKPLQNDFVPPTNKVEEQTENTEVFKNYVNQKRKREPVGPIGRYECKTCQKKFMYQSHLNRHIQSKHEGVKYSCDKCDYQATQPHHLTTHFQSKHEDIRYACDECDYKATHKGALTRHIQSQHEGVMYTCDKCDYQVARQDNLTRHIQLKHDDVRKSVSLNTRSYEEGLDIPDLD